MYVSFSSPCSPNLQPNHFLHKVQKVKVFNSKIQRTGELTHFAMGFLLLVRFPLNDFCLKTRRTQGKPRDYHNVLLTAMQKMTIWLMVDVHLIFLLSFTNNVNFLKNKSDQASNFVTTDHSYEFNMKIRVKVERLRSI